MPVPDPEQLFAQAEKLIAPPAAGAPRQVDLRRAISSVYYGVFHATMTAAADQIVGSTKRNSQLYALVYRSIDHRALRDFCAEVRKPQPGAKIQKYAPSNGFGSNLQAFATAVLELQAKRHSADYDPAVRIKTADARVTVATARRAVSRFQMASAPRRAAFLLLLSFPPR